MKQNSIGLLKSSSGIILLVSKSCDCERVSDLSNKSDHAINWRKERNPTGRFDYLRSDRQVKVCLSMFFLYFYQGLDCFGLSLFGT